MSERSFTWSPEAELDAIRYDLTAAEVAEVFDAPTREHVLRPHLLVMQGRTSTGRVLRLALEPARLRGLYVLLAVLPLKGE